LYRTVQKLFVCLIGLFISFVFILPACAQESANNDSMEGLVEEALLNNPELKTLQEKIAMYEERPPQAESLDNPKLGFALANVPVDTFKFDQEPMTQKQISVMQRIPFPGKLGLKGDIARKELEVVREEYEEKKNSIVMQVETTYRNLLFTEKSLDITRENRDLLRDFVKITETKYAVGEGIQQDVLKAQVELSKMIDLLITLEQKRESIAARLNMLLDRPISAPIRATGEIETPEQDYSDLAFEELQRTAFDTRPSLIGLNRMVEQSRLALALAKKMYYPDFDIGVSYGQRDDGPDIERADFISGSVSITIPLWYKTKESRKVEEERANIRKATELLSAMKNEVSFRIRDIITDLIKYGQKIELFRTGLIPQSAASLESAIAGYQVNKVDFISLVNNQITLYNHKIEYFRAITDYKNKLSELNAVIGKKLF
jgi:cobalt-zinc-cadmium efflux system outer membrane protein